MDAAETQRYDAVLDSKHTFPRFLIFSQPSILHFILFIAL
jgi:hypothetical protein